MATYRQNSPWYLTKQNTLYLELMKYRNIEHRTDDAIYTIEPQYRYRPDLLAFDMYGDAKLWWIFVIRNRSILKDPIFDFEPGTKIFCPKQENVSAMLSSTGE